MDVVERVAVAHLAGCCLARPQKGFLDQIADVVAPQELGGLDLVMTQGRIEKVVDLGGPLERRAQRPFEILPDACDDLSPAGEEVVVEDERAPEPTGVAFGGQEVDEPEPQTFGQWEPVAVSQGGGARQGIAHRDDPFRSESQLLQASLHSGTRRLMRGSFATIKEALSYSLARVLVKRRVSSPADSDSNQVGESFCGSSQLAPAVARISSWIARTGFDSQNPAEVLPSPERPSRAGRMCAGKAAPERLRTRVSAEVPLR
ncbi:MAG: hypothetical protein HC793_01295 [Aquincola sp.]|nr:hypothetical protein [Aquincola sp.]